MQVEIYQNQRQDCKLFKTRLLKFLWPFVFEVNIEIIRHLYKRCTSCSIYQRQDCKLDKTRLLKSLRPFVFEVNILVSRHLFI